MELTNKQKQGIILRVFAAFLFGFSLAALINFLGK